jgi:integrase
MARNQLSETRIKSLDKPGVYGDGDGLWLRVQKGGSRNWVFIWRRGSKRHEMGLGGYGRGTAPVSLALAREKAQVVRGKLARGEDPRSAKAPKVSTFGECMEAVLAIKEAELANPKHVAQWRMTLRDYAEPLHRLPVATATVDDVVACLTPHWTERHETAQRLRSRIAAVFDYARARGLREAGNPAQGRGLVNTLLPARAKLSRGHHAALPYRALPAALAALRSASGVSARAVEFACLTAARTGEVRGATWAEIDFDEKLWTVPASRMKAGKEHRVPLAARAVEILRGQQQRSTGDLIFGGDRVGSAISDTAMTKALRRAAGDDTATLHGLRSSFRDWAGDMTSHPRDVCEAALAHTIGGVEAAYRRSDALAKRRLLMNDWADFCN